MPIITEEQLLKLAGLKPGQRAALRRHLKEAKIPIREVNGRILTTEEAITATLVGRAKAKTEPDLDAIAPKNQSASRGVSLRPRAR